MAEQQFGVQHKLKAPIATTRLAEQPLIGIPPNLSKFTTDEYDRSTKQLYRTVWDQQQLAERVIGDIDRVIDETTERTELLRARSEQNLKERIGDVEFNQRELQIQRKEICLELEALGMYKTRIQDCLANLQEHALNVCRKCLMLREGRVGIDLVVDKVEKALQTEITTIIGAQNILKRTLEQLNEQMRRLRATKYLLDRDLQYKQEAVDFDQGSLLLKPSDGSLAIYEGFHDLDSAILSSNEYNCYSANNIKSAGREISSARPIRVYVDTLLKQIFEDLWNSYDNCNQEFSENIVQIKATLNTLELLHLTTTEKIIAMNKKVIDLKKALVDKERNVGLTHTRLGRRAQRTGAELVRDSAGQALKYECEMLRHSTQQLQQMLHEATAVQRYLLQTQLQIEQDINVKLNSLKIDEVDCMSLREGMVYYKY